MSLVSGHGEHVLQSLDLRMLDKAERAYFSALLLQANGDVALAAQLSGFTSARLYENVWPSTACSRPGTGRRRFQNFRNSAPATAARFINFFSEQQVSGAVELERF